jgi:hypothetical protein
MMPPVVPPPASAMQPTGVPAPNPMAMLASRGQQPGATDQMMSFMMFLAGMGFDKFAATLEKLRGSKSASHKSQTGLGREAAANPQMTGAAQLQQLMAARGGMMGAPGAPPVRSGTPF